MAPSSGSNSLLDTLGGLPEQIQAAIIGDGRALIPVQLPDTPTPPPTRSNELPITPQPIITSYLIESTKPHPTCGSPLQVPRESKAPSESPGSPRSDFSRNSEDSIIIVGDTFSAPANLQFSVDNSPHVRDAGTFDRYSHSISQPASNLSWRREDASPSLTSTPPNLRRPLPSPPHAQPLGSPLTPRYPRVRISPAVLSSSSPIFRPKTSPIGPRPLGRPGQFVDTITKDSRSKKRKKKDEYLKPNIEGFISSPPRPGKLVSNTDRGHHQLPSQPSLDHGLNPFAIVFHPKNNSKSKTPSLSGESGVELISSNQQRLHAAEVYSSHPIQSPDFRVARSETHAMIEQDIHHLRQWSNLFQMHSSAFPEYNQQYRSYSQIEPSFQQHPNLLPLHQHQALLQIQQQQQQQRQAYYQGQFAMTRLSGDFSTGHTPPATNFSAPFLVQQRSNHDTPRHYAQGPQSQPMSSHGSSLPYFQFSSSGSSESSTSTPYSAPPELPIDVRAHALTEIQLPETHLSISAHGYPAFERNDGETIIKKPMGNSVAPVDESLGHVASSTHGTKGKHKGGFQPLGTKTTDPPPNTLRPSSNSLSARGRSTLTPVTERSEISTPNESTSSASLPKQKGKRPKRRPRRGSAATLQKGNSGASKKT